MGQGNSSPKPQPTQQQHEQSQLQTAKVMKSHNSIHTGTLDSVSTEMSRSRRKSKTTPPQNRRQKWKKNYMMMSLPCQSDDIIKLSSLKKEEIYSFTQSLNRQTSQQLRRQKHREKLLKLLQDCAESMEGVVCRSYVESMKSPSQHTSSHDLPQDLIVLDDGQEMSSANITRTVDDMKTRITTDYSKNLSEIVFRDHGEYGSGEVLYMSSDESSKRFLAPKLRLANSFSSSYVEDTDESYTHSEDEMVPYRVTHANAGHSTGSPNVNRNRYTAKLNEEEYRDLVSNGKSTAFMSHHEDEMSLYYDDEFDVEKSPPGMALHDSDMEAAICNEYASLLHIANKTMNFNQSANSSDTHSNFSSDFDNIFPSSLSLNRDIDYTDVERNCEEISGLDESVPNYSDIPATTKKDYRITFTHGDSDLSEDESQRCRTSKAASNKNQIPKPPRLRSGNQGTDTLTKKVSFSDELAVVNENNATHSQRMEEIGNSTTWLQMKHNYTTWGQVKTERVSPERDCTKTQSVPDIKTKAEISEKEDSGIDQKRYSLTLWEQYKRTHSPTLGVIGHGELTTPDAFSEPTISEQNKRTQELAESINNLLDDALLGPDHVRKTAVTKMSLSRLHPLPDLSFLRTTKRSLCEYKWWKEIFDQPSFCAAGGGSRTNSCLTCSGCERKHSTDHHVILFQGSKPAQHKICEVSMLEKLLSPSNVPCHCTKELKERLCDLSSGIATGSSGVTPREPNSWQHIADFLKKRQKQDGGSRGSLNSTLSDQQLLDVVTCIELADSLVKHQQSTSAQQLNSCDQQDLLLLIWKFVSALECVLCTGLKSHKLVSVAIGKIRTRVSIWDIVEESALSAGKLTNIFSQIIEEISRFRLNDPNLKLCLFIVGTLNYQCLDFWLSILTHNAQLMDKYYHGDSYLRSKVMGDRRLHSEMVQSVQPLSLYTWDINYNDVITACTQTQCPPDGTSAANTKVRTELASALPVFRQSPSVAALGQQERANPKLGKSQRYFSANNIRQAVVI